MKGFHKVSKKVVATATLGFSALANAAAVDLPATAQADIEGSVANGGTLLISVTVLILGYLVITRMVKRT